MVSFDILQAPQRPLCLGNLIRGHAEIDVAIRTQRALRIPARDGPTLNQHRFNAGSAQERKHVSQLSFVYQRRQSKATINFVKLLTSRGGCQGCIANLPPGECARAGAAKQRRDFREFSFGYWTLDFGLWSLVQALRTLDLRLWTLAGSPPGAAE
jgi:hypothetical protein